MLKKIQPLYDRIVIERLDNKENITESGIIIADSSTNSTEKGKVVAVGVGHRTISGNLVPLQVKVGDTVLFNKHTSTESGNTHVILREDDILGIF